MRRSSRFDRPQLRTVTLTRAPSGYGLELEGTGPPVIAKVCELFLFVYITYLPEGFCSPKLPALPHIQCMSCSMYHCHSIIGSWYCKADISTSRRQAARGQWCVCTAALPQGGWPGDQRVPTPCYSAVAYSQASACTSWPCGVQWLVREERGYRHDPTQLAPTLVCTPR